MGWAFSVGFLSFALALALPLFYLTSYGVRALGAWLMGKPGPTDRVWALLCILAAAGFVVGSLLQPQWESIEACHRQGRALGQCLLPTPSIR